MTLLICYNYFALQDAATISRKTHHFLCILRQGDLPLIFREVCGRQTYNFVTCEKLLRKTRTAAKSKILYVQQECIGC